MFFDLHLHSRFSIDALSKPSTIVKVCKKNNLSFALTDHNNMNAYFGKSSAGKSSIKHLARSESVFLIPAEEIKVFEVVDNKKDKNTLKHKPKVVGEVIGYFLNKPITPSTFEEVLDEIKSQGALLSCPHPFDWLRKNFKEFPKLWKKFDCMETYNARAYYSGLNKKAQEFSLKNNVAGNIACLGVSDAHTPQEIGNGLTEINAVDEEEFRKEIKKCRTRVVPWAKAKFWHHFQTQLAKRNWMKAR
ncbi:MAG: PHP domain-containing protein [Candidatus Diapherotrites archaeon]|nr:PHP domain-containing protein [Candidatus Diapherotrites archaeon]